MPRPRFTVRRLMLAVAVAAVVLTTVQWWRRRASYAERAEYHRRWSESKHSFTPDGMSEEQMRRAFAEMAAENRFHRDLARKYEHAARYPWLPVAPDPPLPE